MMTVYEKPKALNLTNDSPQWTFESKADWTKGNTVSHTSTPNATEMNEEGLQRQKRRSEETVLFIQLVWF